MTYIKIHTKNVYSVGANVLKQANKVTTIENDVSSVASQIDSQIKSRRSIASQLTTVKQDLNYIENDMQDLQKFIKTSADKYEKAEAKIVKNIKGDKLGNKSSKDSSKSSAPKDKYNSENDNIDVKELLVDGLEAGALGSDILSKFIDFKNFKNGIQVTDDLKFRLVDRNGKIYIKVVGSSMTTANNRSNYIRYRDQLTATFGGQSGTYNKRFVNRLVTDEIPIYVRSGSSYTAIGNNLSRFSNENLTELTRFIGLSNTVNKKKYYTKLVGDEFKSIITDFNWKNTSKLEKFGKGAGIAGNLFSFGSNWVKAEGDKDINNPTDFARRVIVDTSVDLAVGGASAVLGATIGTALIPGVGTIVGAGIGFGAGIIINEIADLDIPFLDDKSLVDVALKEPLNKVADSIVDVVKGAPKFLGALWD